jgi:hypothetical protein
LSSDAPRTALGSAQTKSDGEPFTRTSSSDASSRSSGERRGAWRENSVGEAFTTTSKNRLRKNPTRSTT